MNKHPVPASMIRDAILADLQNIRALLEDPAIRRAEQESLHAGDEPFLREVWDALERIRESMDRFGYG